MMPTVILETLDFRTFSQGISFTPHLINYLENNLSKILEIWLGPNSSILECSTICLLFAYLTIIVSVGQDLETRIGDTDTFVSYRDRR